jgi:hypothetical protein
VFDQLALVNFFAIALSPQVDKVPALHFIDHGVCAPISLNLLVVQTPLGLRAFGDEGCKLIGVSMLQVVKVSAIPKNRP